MVSAARGKKAAKAERKSGAKPARTTKPKAAKPAKEKKVKADKSTDGREGSKKSIILDLLRRKEGATLDDLTNATGWQKHSVHGFLAGQLRKKMGLTVESEKNAEGKRAYRIA